MPRERDGDSLVCHTPAPLVLQVCEESIELVRYDLLGEFGFVSVRTRWELTSLGLRCQRRFALSDVKSPCLPERLRGRRLFHPTMQVVGRPSPSTAACSKLQWLKRNCWDHKRDYRSTGPSETARNCMIPPTVGQGPRFGISVRMSVRGKHKLITHRKGAALRR
jgi:hypothetical protein